MTSTRRWSRCRSSAWRSRASRWATGRCSTRPLDRRYYSLKWRKFDLSRWQVLDELVYDPERHVEPGDYQSWRGDTCISCTCP
jgi:hypothetical protein